MNAWADIKEAFGLNGYHWQTMANEGGAKLKIPFLTSTDNCHAQLDLIPLGIAILALVMAFLYLKFTPRRVYLLDFSCYKPPASQQVTVKQCLWGLHSFGKYENKKNGYKDEIAFQTRIQDNNGVSEKTYGPIGFFQPRPITTLERARQESKLCMMGAVREVFAKTGLKPKDVDFLIVNCSLFNPTPSLSAMIINHFKFKSSIISYNLSGMGCSAGIISVDLARQMLELTPNKYALVVSTENITLNWYKGSQRSFLIPNTLFRIGASAAVMTNKHSELYRAKYQLQNVVRVHLGADLDAYNCVSQKADKEGILGVQLNKDIVKVAAKALESNLTRLGPKVLPYAEQLLFAYDFVLRRFGWRTGKPYQPKFRKAFNHFCLHAGGRGVIEGLGGELGLTKNQLEPSFAALYFYGNTSSSSYWYSFGFAESKHGMRKGDKIWQVGFGSGFKSNSAVWKALRTFKDPAHKAWEHISLMDISDMWDDLAGMGISFVDGVMPPYAEKKKPQPATAPEPVPTAAPAAAPAEPTTEAPEATAVVAPEPAASESVTFEAPELAPTPPPADSVATAMNDAMKPKDMEEFMEPTPALTNGHRKASMKRPEVRPADPYYVHHVAL